MAIDPSRLERAYGRMTRLVMSFLWWGALCLGVVSLALMSLCPISLCLISGGCAGEERLASARSHHQGDGETAAAGTPQSPPQRVVSLDGCADQYVLKFVPPQRIAAVSRDADDDYSFMRHHADDVAMVRPVPEHVLALQPDLIVRSYGGGPGATAFYEGLGITVVQIGWASDLASARARILAVSDKLGARDEGQALLAQMDARLDAQKDALLDAQMDAATRTPGAEPKTLLYVTPGGVTAGPGTSVDDIITHGGGTNYVTQGLWPALPLEALVREQPDMLLTSYFQSQWAQLDAWSAAKHPVMQRVLATHPNIALDPAWTGCADWALADAVEAVAAGLAQDATLIGDAAR